MAARLTLTLGSTAEAAMVHEALREYRKSLVAIANMKHTTDAEKRDLNEKITVIDQVLRPSVVG